MKGLVPALVALFCVIYASVGAQETTWQDDDKQITYTPSARWSHWTAREPVSSGTLSFSSDAQAGYSFTFEGTGFQIYGPKGYNNGFCDYTIDDTITGNFDQYEAYTDIDLAPVLLLDQRNLQAGTHEVVVSNRAGDDGRIARGGQPDIALDYIVIFSPSATQKLAAGDANSTDVTRDFEIIMLEPAPPIPTSTSATPTSSATSTQSSSPASTFIPAPIRTLLPANPKDESTDAAAASQSASSKPKDQTILIAAVSSALAAVAILFGIVISCILYRRRKKRNRAPSTAAPPSVISHRSHATTPSSIAKGSVHSPVHSPPIQMPVSPPMMQRAPSYTHSLPSFIHSPPVQYLPPESFISMPYSERRTSYGGLSRTTRADSNIDPYMSGDDQERPGDNRSSRGYI